MTEPTPSERAARHHAATLMHDAARNITTADIAQAIADDDQLAHLSDRDTKAMIDHIHELAATAGLTTDFTDTDPGPDFTDLVWDEL